MPFYKGHTINKGRVHSAEIRSHMGITLRKPKILVDCNTCSKIMLLSIWRIKRAKKYYCSRACQYISFVGKESWNKGMQGYQAGEKHPNWRGGITNKNLIIRNSFGYKVWRKSIFERDDYRCYDCGQKGGRLNADHIYPFALFPRLRLVLENGRTLCVACHRKTSTWGRKLTNKKYYAFV